MHPVDQNLTFGQRAADWLAALTGSWAFLIVHTVLMSLWVAANTTWLLHRHWDPYPFILLNLLLSMEAAYTNPVILMAGNRQMERDRDLAKWDHSMQVECLELLHFLAEEAVGK